MPETLTPATEQTPKQAQGVGHAAHSQTADSQESLPGKMQRPINVVFLGAGSNFCHRIARDLVAIDGSQGGQIRLVDIDADRLGMMRQVVQKIIDTAGVSSLWSVSATTDRREALVGADYAICCVEVSGLACVEHDNDIPLKYGVDQCIGDTVGPGGVFKALRTAPVFLEILRDMAELCPGAPMLNYTNPMNIMVLSAGRAVPQVPVVGLCHSVQGTSHLLAKYAGVPYEAMRWECAGINHLAWFTRLEHQGQDLYQSVLMPKFADEIEQAYREADAGLSRYDSADNTHGNSAGDVRYQFDDLVRKDMCLHFGAFITESSGHLSEYLPYYRKSDTGRKLLRLGYHGGSRFYATNWPQWRAAADEERRKLVAGEQELKMDRSWEYGSWIIEAMEKDFPYRIHGNVMNYRQDRHDAGEAGRLISNLTGDGCVEVACLVDGNGVQPTRYGKLPAQMAHICAANMACFDLAATAVVEKSVEATVHAMLLDPLCQAVLTPKQIKDMTLEMFEAEKDFLPGFA